VFENKVLRRIFEPVRGRYQEDGENCVMKNFIIFIHQTALG
jgi:hypothetical protein